jgi:dephospho-CoA kinase
MLNIGLTGSIAAGKSFVAGVFKEHGCHVLDSDVIAREVVRPGTEGLNGIVANFGGGVLNPDGTLDRKALGLIVFADTEKRQLLNSLLHPLIMREQERWLDECESKDPFGVAVIDAALMIETGSYKRFDDIVVVWCEGDIQLERLMNRDAIGKSAAMERIEAQLSQDEKKEYASYLIDTSRGFEETRSNAVSVIEILRKKAGSKEIV